VPVNLPLSGMPSRLPTREMAEGRPCARLLGRPGEVNLGRISPLRWASGLSFGGLARFFKFWVLLGVMSVICATPDPW
jgi:hypothetical protein